VIDRGREGDVCASPHAQFHPALGWMDEEGKRGLEHQSRGPGGARIDFNLPWTSRRGPISRNHSISLLPGALHGRGDYEDGCRAQHSAFHSALSQPLHQLESAEVLASKPWLGPARSDAIDKYRSVAEHA